MVRFRGELDIGAAPDIKAAVVAHLEPGDRELIVDLHGVTFMDSSAVRALLDCERTLGADGIELTVRNAPTSAETVVRAVQTVSDGPRHRWFRFWSRPHRDVG